MATGSKSTELNGLASRLRHALQKFYVGCMLTQSFEDQPMAIPCITIINGWEKFKYKQKSRFSMAETFFYAARGSHLAGAGANLDSRQEPWCKGSSATLGAMGFVKSCYRNQAPEYKRNVIYIYREKRSG